MSTRLDPEEALARPLYVVAFALVLIPTLDFVFSIPPAEFSSVQWRFAAVGLLSGFAVMPMMGLALACVIAGMLRQFHVVRLLVFLCLTTALVLIVITLGSSSTCFSCWQRCRRMAAPRSTAHGFVPSRSSRCRPLCLRTLAGALVG